MNCAGCFVAHYQRVSWGNFGADAAVGPEMNVAAADADIFNADYHDVRIGGSGVGAVLNLCNAWSVEETGGILGRRHCWKKGA